MPIDYERMKRVYPKQKAALARAKKITDPIARKFKMIEVCRAAVREWNIIGAWPDGWALWQRELSDALSAAQRAGDNQMHVGVNQLEDLA